MRSWLAPEASYAALASSSDEVAPRRDAVDSPVISVASQMKRSASRASSTRRLSGAESPEYASTAFPSVTRKPYDAIR